MAMDGEKIEGSVSMEMEDFQKHRIASISHNQPFQLIQRRRKDEKPAATQREHIRCLEYNRDDR